MAWTMMTNNIARETIVWATNPNVFKAGTKGSHKKYIAIRIGHKANERNISLVLYEYIWSKQAAM